MVRSWTTDDVADYLECWDYAELAEPVRDNAIDGEAFLMLDHEALKDIGVVKVGTRLRLLRLIREIAEIEAQLLKLGLLVGPATMVRLQEQTGRLQRVEENFIDVKQSIYDLRSQLHFDNDSQEKVVSLQDDANGVSADLDASYDTPVEVVAPSPGTSSSSEVPPTALFDQVHRGLQPRQFGSAPNLSSSPPDGSKRPRPVSDPIPLWRESLIGSVALDSPDQSTFDEEATLRADSRPTPVESPIASPSRVEALRKGRSSGGLRLAISHGNLKQSAGVSGNGDTTPSPSGSQRPFQNFFSAAKNMLQRSNSSSQQLQAPLAKSPTSPVHEAAILDSLMVVGLMPTSPRPPRPSRRRSVKAKKSPPATAAAEAVATEPAKKLEIRDAGATYDLEIQMARPPTHETALPRLYPPPPQIAPTPPQAQLRIQNFNIRRPPTGHRPLRVAIPSSSLEPAEKPLPTLPTSCLQSVSMPISATASPSEQRGPFHDGFTAMMQMH